MRLIGNPIIFLAASAGAVSASSPTIRPITLPPLPPPSSAQKLDPCLASFSIEFSYLPSFGGNLSSPNLLTKALMERIVERTGVGPDVRPGGITMYGQLPLRIYRYMRLLWFAVTAAYSHRTHLRFFSMRVQ